MPETNLTIMNPKTNEKKTFRVKSRWRWLARIKYILVASWMILRYLRWQISEVETTDPQLYWDFLRRRKGKTETKVKLLYGK